MGFHPDGSRVVGIAKSRPPVHMVSAHLHAGGGIEAVGTAATTRAANASAYHEVGHAVIAFLSGHLPRPVRITLPRAPRAGCDVTLPDPAPWSAHVAEAWTPAVRLRIEDEILFLLGGPAAERAAGMRRLSRCRHDRRRAIDLARQYCGGDAAEAEALFRWLDVRATKLIAQHWTRIEALAAALLERRALDASAIRAILIRGEDREPSADDVRRASEPLLAASD
ncbi:MAG TPA: hypothetical protein VFD84_15625 [Candidatus Binatia bacterium]|nr:hypothetical protein [Candidatus Binatia bacterium]